jgi:arginyl-tRNA synthetase
VHLRYREALGEDIGDIPEGMYPGDYLKPVGTILAAQYGGQYVGKPEADWLPIFRDAAIKAMLDLIRHDLGLLNIHHDKFSSEADLQGSGAVVEGMDVLRSKGLVYEGTLERPKSLDPHDEWEPVELTLFRSSQFGDDQDRPMKKSDGSWTYFGSDAAYHWQKAKEADHLVNIWGADHAGTVKRVQAAVKALTDGRVDLDVKLIQMVRLFRDGEPVKMSKRAGDFVTLADVVNEVGKDVVRFMMLTKRADTPLDFDFTKVVEASKDNPVFYVQYAHARISSLKRKAADAGVSLDEPADLSLLDDEELSLVKRAAQYPRALEGAALTHEPHRIAFYLYDLAAEFHALWNRGNDDPERRFLLEKNPQLSRARLELAMAIAQVIRSGLDLMGVAATEEMR